MYKIETNRVRRLIRFKATGFFDETKVDLFRGELRAVITELTMTHGGFKILADFREIGILPQAAVKSIQDQMRWTASNGVEQSATLVSSMLQQMQIKRIVPDERFRCFTSEGVALRWLGLQP